MVEQRGECPICARQADAQVENVYRLQCVLCGTLWAHQDCVLVGGRGLGSLSAWPGAC